MKSGEQLAEEHTEWFMSMMTLVIDETSHGNCDCPFFGREQLYRIMRKIFHDSMIHGYKHGIEDRDDRE